MDIKQQLQTMFVRLANYHWSPKHPSEYVITSPEGKKRGIGLIAHKNYGAFNLAWAATEGKCSDHQEQTEIVTRFVRYQTTTSFVLNDVPLSDWLCLLRPKGFHQMIQVAKGLPPDMKMELLTVSGKAMDINEALP